MTIIQRGRNPKYPQKTEKIWRWGDPNPPEWLTDEAKIKDIEQGNYVFDTIETSMGGLIIKRAQGDDLVTLKDKNSYVIFSKEHGFQSLTELQKDLLYYTKAN